MTTAISPRAAAKRHQIAAAARTLFLADGFARTTMDAVTLEAGVSKQTLYAYFPGKEELLREVVLEELADLAVVRPAVELESLEQFRSILIAVAEGLTSRLMTEERIALLRLLIGEASHVPTIRSLFYDTLPARVIAEASALIRRADQAGLIHVPRPDLSVRFFVGPVMSFIALDGWMAEKPRLPSRDDLEIIVDGFLRSLGVPR